MPEDAEKIAIVKASFDSDCKQQGSLDYAVDELKIKAAKAGASTVVLPDRDTSSQTVGNPVYGGGNIVTSSEPEVVEGTDDWID